MDISTLTLIDALILGLLGRLLMYLFLKQPVSQWIASKSSFFRGMFECDLCLGMWAYWILALIFRLNLFEGYYIPVLSEFFVGAFMTFLAHLVRIGWEAKFSIIHIGE